MTLDLVVGSGDLEKQHSKFNIQPQRKKITMTQTMNYQIVNMMSMKIQRNLKNEKKLGIIFINYRG